MILRHALEAQGARSCEDTFEAIDEHNGSHIAGSVILVRENEALFPNRPIRVLIEFNGEPLPDALIGASVARAKEIAREFERPARVFTAVTPDNEEMLSNLAILGMKDNDGIIVLKKTLADESPAEITVPIGCVHVEDTLDDETEQRYFLDRYTRILDEDHDYEWLNTFIKQDDFHRFILIANNGMAGEIISCRENDIGKIIWFNVPARWRDMGIASALIALTCERFRNMGVTSVECEIQARMPGVLRLLEKNGFKQNRLVMRYPGTDIN